MNSSPGPLQSVIVMKLTQRDTSVYTKKTKKQVKRQDIHLECHSFGCIPWKNRAGWTRHTETTCKEPYRLTALVTNIASFGRVDKENFSNLIPSILLICKHWSSIEQHETISPRFNSFFQSGSGANHSITIFRSQPKLHQPNYAVNVANSSHMRWNYHLIYATEIIRIKHCITFCLPVLVENILLYLTIHQNVHCIRYLYMRAAEWEKTCGTCLYDSVCTKLPTSNG